MTEPELSIVGSDSSSIPAHEADRDPVADLARELGPELLRYFARRVVPAEDAADCLSETLLALWRRRDALPVSATERRAWAYGVARNVLANHRRSHARRHALIDRLRLAISTAPGFAPASEDSPALQALTELNERDRELVLLVIWEELTLREAAAALGTTEAAARKRYFRARAQLKSTLTQHPRRELN